MAKLSAIAADLEKVENGVWTQYELGIELLIASVNSKGYREARERAVRPHMRQIRNRQMSNEEIVDLLKPAVARYLLLGWRHLEDDKGSPIPYSPEKAMELFNDPRFNQFYLDVMELAGETDQYRQELLEDAEKNLPSGSIGGCEEATP